jgi:molecular chaperone GrpE
MSDVTSPIIAAGPGDLGAEAVNADAVETILADFRAWLFEAKENPPTAPAAELDVATIVQHFTALRQEVNLQTKSSRVQLEQNAQTMVMLQQALEALQGRQAQSQQSEKSGQDELVRPLLKTLLDAHDALSLAEREVQRLLVNPPAPPRPEITPAPAVEIRLPFWARWLGLRTSIEEQIAPLRTWRGEQPPPPGLDEYAQRFRQVLDALLVGYRMSLQRIERAFEQQGLEAIACVGQPFDPEIMEVAEVVRVEGRPSTEVVQEIRRGYLWQGRLFRYAQVRVAKP